jgi:small conductance mechanosensitive channel
MFAPLELLQTKLLSAAQELVLVLPNLVAAVVLLAAVWYGGKWLARMISRLSAARGRPDLGALLGALARVMLMCLALLVASAIVFPTMHPGDIFAALGIGSVAVGLAFKDILQNVLAGFLLVIQRPYRRGDQVAVKGYEGTVELVESRATLLITYDGLRVLVPNSDMYTQPVVVNTAFALHRNELVVTVRLGADLPQVLEQLQTAVSAVEGVAAEPGVEVIPWDLNHAQVDLKLRWWADARRLPQVEIKGRVILAVNAAAIQHGVVLPYPTSAVVLDKAVAENREAPGIASARQ